VCLSAHKRKTVASMITIDAVSAKPAGVVNEIVSVLERLLDVWRT
jgi:hypothetical protein